MASLRTPHIRDRYSYRIVVSYHAIEPRTRYDLVALLSFLRRTCDVCMANRSCYERVAIFSNMFEIIVTPFRTLANEKIVQCISYDSFRCCDVVVAYRAIRDTPYVRKPIRKCVRAVLRLRTFCKDRESVYSFALTLDHAYFSSSCSVFSLSVQ